MQTRTDLSTAPQVSMPEPHASPRRRDLQGIRAIAILSVVIYHADIGLPGGFVGVDIFFVLSGFLITRLLFQEIQLTGKINYAAFVLRRARRLIPAQVALTFCVVIGSALLLSPLDPTQDMVAKASLFGTLFAANAFFAVNVGYFVPAAEENPLLHLWSLAVEEQYYFVFPLLVTVAWAVCRGRSAYCKMLLLAIALGCSFLACLLASFNWIGEIGPLSAVLGKSDIAVRIAFYSPATRAWEFLIGTAVAIVVDRIVLKRWTAGGLGCLGLSSLILSFVVIDKADPFPGVVAVLPVAATSCILLSGSFGYSTSVSRFLGSAPLVGIGNISYSWYLWHWPVIVFANVWLDNWRLAGLWAAVASLLPAMASYRFIERPFLNKSICPTSRSFRNVVAVAVIASLTSALALHVVYSRNWFRSDLSVVAAVVTPEHINLAYGCANGVAVGPRLPATCTWRTAGARETILLIGDSNAGHFTEPLIGAARVLNMNLQVATASGCPFLAAHLVPSSNCEEFVSSSLRAIASRRRPYAAIVIANFSVGYINRGLNFDPRTRTAIAPSRSDRSGDLRRWIEALEKTLVQLGDRSPLLLVGAVPQFEGFPACMSPSVIAQASHGCGKLAPNEVKAKRGDIIMAEEVVAKRMKVRYIDTGRQLCTAEVGCSVYARGVLAYRDGGHLSVQGSQLFKPIFVGALSDELRLG